MPVRLSTRMSGGLVLEHNPDSPDVRKLCGYLRRLPESPGVQLGGPHAECQELSNGRDSRRCGRDRGDNGDAGGG
jgi:hypothetical protein